MERVARRARIETKTDCLSKKEKRYIRDFSSKAREVAVKPRQCKVEFDLKSAIARYKRLGDLPGVDVEVVRAVAYTGPDGRALKRMIREMLLRSGVEPNPGPTDIESCTESESCKHSGRVVVGERVRLSGKSVLICPLCPVRLSPIRKGSSQGRHPGEMLHVQDEVPRKLEVKITKIEPPAPVLQAAKPAHALALLKPEPAKPVLRGHKLSDDDIVAVMSRLSGLRTLTRSQVQVEKITVDYQGERRLVSNRGVDEVKQAFKAVQMTVRGCFKWDRAAVGAACTIWCFCIPFFYLAYGYDNSFKAYLALLFTMISAAAYAYLASWRGVLRVPYIPHLVSTVVSEYDSGTNAAAVNTTIRQRIRRLAALPIPDRDALAFINGSEQVAKQLIASENFFEGGAVCFRQPR